MRQGSAQASADSPPRRASRATGCRARALESAQTQACVGLEFFRPHN